MIDCKMMRATEEQLGAAAAEPCANDCARRHLNALHWCEACRARAELEMREVEDGVAGP